MISGVRWLVLYDGVCGLCDKTVQFLLRIDRGGVLRFAPLQGSTAPAILLRHGVPPAGGEGFKSLVLVCDVGKPEEKIYLRSEGVLRILGTVGGFWRMISWLRIVPRFIRDTVYNWVARNRYGWFGKFDACRLPSLKWQSRFLP
jgi:predicted DCC family thiol-disulfide oxidoreductase YuxK